MSPATNGDLTGRPRRPTLLHSPPTIPMQLASTVLTTRLSPHNRMMRFRLYSRCSKMYINPPKRPRVEAAIFRNITLCLLSHLFRRATSRSHRVLTSLILLSLDVERFTAPPCQLAFEIFFVSCLLSLIFCSSSSTTRVQTHQNSRYQRRLNIISSLG